MAVPFVTIILDKPYKIRFGMKVMAEFEQITSEKLSSINEDAMPIGITMKLLWIMLKQENTDLTYDQTISLVDDNADDMGYIMQTVGGAIKSAFPVKKAVDNPIPNQ